MILYILLTLCIVSQIALAIVVYLDNEPTLILPLLLFGVPIIVIGLPILLIAENRPIFKHWWLTVRNVPQNEYYFTYSEILRLENKLRYHRKYRNVKTHLPDFL